MGRLAEIVRFLEEHGGSYETYIVAVSDRRVAVHATKRPMTSGREHKIEVPLDAGVKREAALGRFLEQLKEDLP